MNFSKTLKIREVAEIFRVDEGPEIRTIYEKLRNEHISTLEHVQLLTNEITVLQQELRNIRVSGFSSVHASDEEIVDPDDVLLRKIGSQEKEMKSLKSSLSQANGDLKSAQAQFKSQHQQDFELRRKVETKMIELELSRSGEISYLKSLLSAEVTKNNFCSENMSVLKRKIIQIRSDNIELIKCWRNLFNNLDEEEKKQNLSVGERIDDKINFGYMYSQLRRFEEDKRNRDQMYYELLKCHSNLTLQLADSKKEASRLKDVNLGMLVLNDRFLRELSQFFLVVDSDATPLSSFQSEKKTLISMAVAGNEDSSVSILYPTASDELLT